MAGECGQFISTYTSLPIPWKLFPFESSVAWLRTSADQSSSNVPAASNLPRGRKKPPDRCDPLCFGSVLEENLHTHLMISFWHLTAVCCVPKLNPERRVREQEIFHEVAKDAPRRNQKGQNARVRGRWELRELALAGKD